MSHVQATPVGGKLTTPFFNLMALVALVGAAALVVRFGQGLGAASGMTDGYAWGIWIALDVVVGTALGCGGYAMALMVYVANRGKYHPLVRPAMLTGALGYSFAAMSIIVDVGRYWGMWKIPTYVSWWNFDSALLEVALCVMTYVLVLWIEFSPVDPRALARLRDPWPAHLRRVGRSPARPGPALDHRPRPPAPHHAPVVAGHGDDAALLEDAPALVLPAPAPALPGERLFLGYAAVTAESTVSSHGLQAPLRDPAARLPGSRHGRRGPGLPGAPLRRPGRAREPGRRLRG